MADPSVDQDMRGPGVAISPPLIYLAFFLVGIALGWAFPLPPSASRLGQFVGGAMAFASWMTSDVRPESPTSARRVRPSGRTGRPQEYPAY